jgi:hypothetical protein
LGELIDGLPFPYSLGLLLFEVLGLGFLILWTRLIIISNITQAAAVFFFFFSLAKKRNNKIIKNSKIQKRSDFAGFQLPEVRENLSKNHQIYILGFLL